MRKFKNILFAMVFLLPLNAFAEGIDSGDTAWLLTSTALVLMMTIPGLFLFYGGLVRKKNVLSTITHSFAAAALISVSWVLIGYTLAFGGSESQFVGSLDHIGLKNIIGAANGTIPDYLFVAFQATFAIITVALITGAIAERAKFASYVLFAVLWSTLIYSPLCYWVWGGGWIGSMGALDFAGGTVVHMSSGTAALVAAFMYGRRAKSSSNTPHNVPFVVAGAALLWVGWFGFNAGSALGANGDAALAFLNTNTAAAAAVIGWMLSEWVSKGVPTVVGAASGAIAGLVAITPAAGFVDPISSLYIGLIAGIICSYACSLKTQFGFDDTLDVVAIHGIGGLWGTIATGIFAVGIASNFAQVVIQMKAAAGTIIFVAIGTYIILFVIDQLFGLRVDEESETKGLDISEHGNEAYGD